MSLLGYLLGNDEYISNEYTPVNIELKNGTIRKGVLVTHKMFPALKQYTSTESLPMANASVDMDSVKEIKIST